MGPGPPHKIQLIISLLFNPKTLSQTQNLHHMKMLSPARFLRLHRHRRLHSSSATPPSPSPNPKPISSLINPIIKLHDPDALVSLFNLSSADPRFRLHSPIYSSTVRRLSSAGRPDAVEALIEHQKSHPDFARSEPFASRLILLYGKAHMKAHALSTFKSLKCPRSALSLNSLLSAFADDPDRLETLIQEVQSEFPDIEPTVVSYNTIISALCKKQEFEQAMEVVERMESKGISPNLVTYNTLLNGFYSAERFDDGERIWERMEERDVMSFNARLRGLVSSKRVPDAEKVFDEMQRVGVKPDIYSFNALMKGYCECGMLEEAKRVYLDLGKHGCHPDLWTFKMLVVEFWIAKEFDFAARLCNESINYGCYLSVETLQAIVDGLAKEEMLLKAKKLVKLARSRSFYGSKCLKMPLSCFGV